MQPFRIVAYGKHFNKFKTIISAPLFLPNFNNDLVYIFFLVAFIIAVVVIFKNMLKITLGDFYFGVISLVIISSFSLLSFIYPKFSFVFMIFITCILTVFTIPYEIFTGFNLKQKYLFKKFLIFLDKTLILDYFSVIFVKFFCVPTKKFIKRLVIIFCLSLCYIICSRIVFIQVVFWNKTFSYNYNFLIYMVLFIGIAVVYFRLLINLSMFLVFSALRIDRTLLSPSILFILDQEDSDMPNKPLASSRASNTDKTDKKFSFINVTITRDYYRQYFNNANPTTFRYVGYGVAICGAIAACGTFWYSRVQAQASIVQAEQARIQSYHTAREADVAAVEAGLITKDIYYQRHPEDLPKESK